MKACHFNVNFRVRAFKDELCQRDFRDIKAFDQIISSECELTEKDKVKEVFLSLDL